MKFDDKLGNETKCFADDTLKKLSEEDVTSKVKRQTLLGKYKYDTLKKLSEEDITSKLLSKYNALYCQTLTYPFKLVA
jgi:hypothetical protein